jgi:predicted phosphodiesterase
LGFFFFGGYMSIGVVGDIHGQIQILRDVVNETKAVDSMIAVIQVGDMSLSHHDISDFKRKSYGFAKPTYWVKGNHEYWDVIDGLMEVTELVPNLFYVPNGTVLEIDGRVVAFMGGAASIDKAYQGSHWSDKENIRPEEVELLYKNIGDRKVDLLVSHAPPQCVVTSWFDKNGRGARVRKAFGVPVDWQDPNMTIIENIWDKLGRPQMVCGHMHENVIFENKSQILAEFQFSSV